MKKKIFLFAVVGLLIFASCNKVKKQSKRISKEGQWSATIYVDDELFTEGTWHMNECKKPYDDLCTGSWTQDELELNFYWQFQEKAEVFVFQKQDKEGELEADEVKFHNDAYQMSGSYTVLEAEKEHYLFEATDIMGFDGQKVVIELNK